MALTDTAIRKTKPSDKPIQNDGQFWTVPVDQTQRLKTLVYEVPHRR